MSLSSDLNAWPPLETAQSILLGLIAFTAAIAPLGLPIIVALLFLVTLVQNSNGEGRVGSIWPTLRAAPPHLAAIAFIAFAALSSTWSVRPLNALMSVAQCGLLTIGAWYVATALDAQMGSIGKIRRTRFIRAFPLALPFVGLYFGLDALTEDGATLFFIHSFPQLFDGFEDAILFTKEGVAFGLSDIFFNRTAAALVLITVSATAALQFWPHPTWGPLLGIVTTIGLILICLKSGSATALLAITTAICVFGLALWSSKITMRLLQMTFLLLTIAAIPLSMLPKKAGLDTDLRLPYSFRERAIIWNDLAHLALTSPWLGVGVKSVKNLTQWPGQMSGEHKPSREPSLYVHPHNGYLQVWVEMGMFGASLFTLAGSLLLASTQRLKRTMQPYALALAGATMTMIGPGWELWQPWLIAAIGSGWIGLIVLRSEFEGMT